jgi:LCP family protein required for cell wall assembly
LLAFTACNSINDDNSIGLPRHNQNNGNEVGTSDTNSDSQSDPDINPSENQDTGSVWGNYPGPTVPSYIAISPPVGIYAQPDNQINFLLLGSDQRPDEGGFRTDAILLGTINFDTKEVNLVSIPRDLYVYIPGYGLDRINTTLVRGDEETLRLTFEYNFGVQIDNFMIINFDGFKALIDILGGIDVYATIDMTDKHPTLGDDFTVSAGNNHMDGETALFYVRARKNSSDFDRARRQQEVIKALLDRILKFDVIALIPDLYHQLKNTIQTDLSLGDIITYTAKLPDFAKIDDLSMYRIGSEQTIPWINPSNGASVLIPIDEDIQTIIKQSINYGE